MVFGDWFIDGKKGDCCFCIGWEDDVGEVVGPEKSPDFASDMPSGVIFNYPFFWVVKLYCPYDPKDSLLTKVVDVVNSRFKSWNCPTEVGVDYPFDKGEEGFYLLKGYFFVTGWGAFSFLHKLLF